MASPPPALIDGFGRQITYLRLSVTDRCDLRCTYCMDEVMAFSPRRDLLALEEVVALADLFIARGVRRIRLTGGEPLVRGGIDRLAGWLGERIGHGLDELTLTTNGIRLDRLAAPLARAGVRRINVSLDTLDPDRFRALTRGGDHGAVLRGLAAARDAGLKVKINMVVLAHDNLAEVPAMLRWCGAQGFDLSLIESMPLGSVARSRADDHASLAGLRDTLSADFRLTPSAHRTGGPARYWDAPDLGIRLGLIMPFSDNFCAGCNRVRLTATGALYACLGRSQKVELRDALRGGGPSAVALLLDQLVEAKPLGHQFDLAAPAPAQARHMNVTGG